MLKSCSKCNSLLPIESFGKRASARDGLQKHCGDCIRKYKREYREKNIDKFKVYQDKYTLNNPSKVREAQEKYRKENPLKKRASADKYREKNRETLRVKNSEYSKRTREQRYEYTRNYKKRFPNKYRAHFTVQTAVSRGKMEKPKNCSECNKEGMIIGHHCDYLKPMEVIWLCHFCHSQWHKLNGEGRNAITKG